MAPLFPGVGGNDCWLACERPDYSIGWMILASEWCFNGCFSHWLDILGV